MNTVLDKVATAATEQTRRHEEIDHLVALASKQIALLIQPITAAWPCPGSFPGQDRLVDADDLLLHLSDTAMEWDEDRPKPSTGNLLDEVQTLLEQSIEAFDAIDGQDGHHARRLLTGEALTRAKAACAGFRDAHLRNDDAPLRALASGASIPRSAPEPIPEPEPTSAADRRMAQHAKVFDGIALQASILLRLVDSASTSTDAGELMGSMDAIRIIVASIGSLADGFNGDNMRGNQYGWHLGEDMTGDTHA